MKLILPDFATKRDLYGYLVEKKADFIGLAKMTPKHADAFGGNYIEAKVSKEYSKEFNTDSDTAIKRTVIGNTYNWMDSHDDVHLSGVFSKSINERKAWHLHDHLFQVMAKVGRPEKIYEKYIDWVQLGVNKSGQTQALFMDSEILKEYNSQIFLEYKNGEINQHSVGMQYVKLSLAINDKEYKEEFATWNKVYPILGNPETADKKGYFWAVEEAKLIEISCVLEGSNTLTHTLSQFTDNEPPSTQSQPKSRFATMAIKNK